MGEQGIEGNVGGASELSQVVSSISFAKAGYLLHVMPGIFIAPGLVLLLYSIPSIYSGYGSLVALPQSVTLLLAYLVASVLSSYYLLQLVKKHLYESSVVTYYFTRGKSFEGALLYIRNAIASSTLPSPGTGMLLVFLTGAYPVILLLARKALRAHMREEEKALLGKAYTSEYGIVNIALDLALTIATLGLYMSYLAYETIRDYNRHIEIIHGSHPNPPSQTIVLSGEQHGGPVDSVIGVVATTIGLSWLLSYLGIPYSFVANISIGIAWFALNYLMRNRNYPLILLANIAMVYVLMATGIVTGIAGYSVYMELFRGQLEQLKESVASLDLAGLAVYIFTNNIAIALPSIIPFGSVSLASGTYNAGIIVGVAVYGRSIDEMMRMLSFLTYPYAILELLGYAVIASSIARIHTSWKYIAIILLGSLILFTAAVLEALTIVSSRGLTG